MEINFFKKSAEKVAKELLGMILVREFDGKKLKAKIVETEAYFDESDPASRACQNGDLKETMKMPAGTILVYGVHNNWLVNFVTGEEGKASAVLIRALEPLNFNEKCNGPGLLTKALKIRKEFHKQNVINNKHLGLIKVGKKKPIIGESFRIGVKKDLDKPLRFFINGNKYLSRK